MDIDLNYLNTILQNFENAIKNNEDEVYIGYSVDKDLNVYDYWVQKKDWIKMLDLLIELSAEIEEYEMSLKFKKIKDSLTDN